MRNRTHLDWHNEIRKTMGLSQLSNDRAAIEQEKRDLLKKLRKERTKNQELRTAKLALTDAAEQKEKEE